MRRFDPYLPCQIHLKEYNLLGKVKCLGCGVILHSTYRHDFQMCDCPNQTFVDGGYDYTRIGGMNIDLIEVIDDPKPDDEAKPVKQIKTRSRRTPPKWNK